MQTLRQYIDRSKKARTHEEWAEFFGISRSHFTEILNGTAFPGKRVIQRIAERTNGKVPLTIWFQQGEAAE